MPTLYILVDGTESIGASVSVKTHRHTAETGHASAFARLRKCLKLSAATIDQAEDFESTHSIYDALKEMDYLQTQTDLQEDSEIFPSKKSNMRFVIALMHLCALIHKYKVFREQFEQRTRRQISRKSDNALSYLLRLCMLDLSLLQEMIRHAELRKAGSEAELLETIRQLCKNSSDEAANGTGTPYCRKRNRRSLIRKRICDTVIEKKDFRQRHRTSLTEPIMFSPNRRNPHKHRRIPSYAPEKTAA